MKIAIFEIGDFYDTPDIIRVFSSVAKAKENIPSGFKELQDFPSSHLSSHHYEDGNKKRWLSIKEYEVEG